jgi:butyrate kinase
MAFQVLVINPGSTSTKIAWFLDEEKSWQETVFHDPDEIGTFPSVVAQYEYRLRTIERTVAEKGSDLDALSAVVGRGGIVAPIPGGTYIVDDLMLEHLRRGKPWEHASNLGGIIARAIAEPRDIPAFIVDPVAVDEMDDISRVTGLPELPKYSLAHTLNVKATVRLAARDLGKAWDELDVVVAHLGGGITICAHSKGRMIDVNNANEFGPFSPERAGGVPAADLVRFCFSGEHTLQDVRRRLVGKGGVMGYLGTSDMREVKKRMEAEDEFAGVVYRSMALQIAKEIASYAVSLEGKLDAILVTGGIAHDSDFIKLVQERIQWIAPVLIYPGEDEMSALNQGALRVLRGEEKPRIYGESIKQEA